jgi:mono/diheme cytochrome c family protein
MMMKKTVLLSGIMLLAFAVPGFAAVAFKSLQLTLPPGTDSYPGGPNVEIVNRNCLACHSADMVLKQPLFPRSTWAAEVTKMRNVYKAPVSDADVALIVDYLAAMHAPPAP